RDCSVQRRFQKVVEIAPAPTLSPATKQKLYDYALAIARHVRYNNAGTVEFLVDPDENIYFIEVNPRIQVEHTVTEEVTGIDIVRSQIILATGRPLSSAGLYFKRQEDITCDGFAIQCRITTEDPTNGFKPDYGTIVFYRNAGGFGIRIDEGSSYTGVRVSPFFDSMLAKVTASGRTFRGACQRLHRTLTEFRIRGVKTNIPFLEKVIMHPVFLAGEARVNFIDSHPELLRYQPKQDRGTRTLRFLADVTVNGNPSVKRHDPDVVFKPARVPAHDAGTPPPPGTKQRLTELGREGFAAWVKEQRPVLLTDTTFRDAHQSLLATRMRTKDLIAPVASYVQHHPNLFSLEVWGGATFDVAMRFLREDPWDRLRQFRAAAPNTLLQMLLRGSNAVGYKAYPDNLVVRFVEASAREGIDVFRIFDSLNWVENMRVSIQAVRERTESLAEACICYTGDILDPSRTKYDLPYYLDLARQLEDAGAHLLAIKDMAGLLKPYAAERLVSELKGAVDLPIHLHTHDTSAAQLATYLKAVEAGVDVVDVAIGSMSGLTSQPNFNTLVEVLRTGERAPDVDVASLQTFSDYWETVRTWYYPFESGLKAGAADVYQHEIPGGQYSNLRPQAASLGLEDQMPTIKRTYAAVNQMFGDITKVTPSSKVVGDMALYMVANQLTPDDVMTRGETIPFPASVKGFFRGDLGQPPGGFPPELQKIVLKDEQPFTERPNAHLEPVDFDAELTALHERWEDDTLGELDLLSALLYPQVFEEYQTFRNQFDDVSRVPTPPFFYGLKPGEETLIEIDSGKSIIVRLQYVGPPDDRGMRAVSFVLNGQVRSIDVRDQTLKVERAEHQKAREAHEVGTPLQGLLSRILVKPGEVVKKNTPLFVIEAMKMETTVTAQTAGEVDRLVLPENTMVDLDDLVVVMR
ncbi:MAG: pyruvate carboxylase, partial [Catalinimonas sp.]